MVHTDIHAVGRRSNEKKDEEEVTTLVKYDKLLITLTDDFLCISIHLFLGGF